VGRSIAPDTAGDAGALEALDQPDSDSTTSHWRRSHRDHHGNTRVPGFLSSRSRQILCVIPYVRREAPVHFDADFNGYLLSLHADVAAAYRDTVFSSRSYEKVPRARFSVIAPVIGKHTRNGLWNFSLAPELNTGSDRQRPRRHAG